MDDNSKNGRPLTQSRSSSLEPSSHHMRSSARLREKAVLFQILDNPSLREEILKRAIIYGRHGVLVNRQTACNLRLVHSSWNDSVLRILWKAKQPLYRLYPSRHHRNFGEALETFATSSSLINGRAPPLKVSVFGDIRWPETLENFSNCLTRCGSQLLQISISSVNEFGQPLESLLPPWRLPRLQKLEITVKRGYGFQGRFPTAQVAIEPEKVISYLINSILSGSTTLTKMNLFINRPRVLVVGPPPSVLESVTFPATLAKMKIGDEMAQQDLEVLTATPLLGLTSLTLSVGKALFENGILFRILDNLRFTLKSLKVSEEQRYEGPPRDAKTIRFPVMEQLEELSITSINAELEEQAARSLPESFPKLHTLRLRHQTEAMLRMWTRYAKLDSVTSLELLLADENGNEYDLKKFLVSVNAEAMKMANLAFPNLRKLELGVYKADTSGLKYVFLEMRQLAELRIRVCSVKSEKSTNVWDSILTGVSTRMIGVSKRHPNYLVKIEHEDVVSIKNLQELTNFFLDDCREFSHIEREQFVTPKPFFSDFTFNHALLKMPKLRNVDADFQASDEIRERWLSEGRTFL